MIKKLCVLRFTEEGELTDSDIVDISHRYSKNIEHLEYSVENPYIKASDWGWPIGPVGLRYTMGIIDLISFTKGEMKKRYGMYRSLG